MARSYIQIMMLGMLLCTSAKALPQEPPGDQGAPSPRAKPTANRIKMGSRYLEGNLVKRVKPVYPDEAKAKHLKGRVKLRVIVGTDGTVKNVELVNGDSILAKAAADAVRQWTYKPTLLNGNPVEVDSTVDVEVR